MKVSCIAGAVLRGWGTDRDATAPPHCLSLNEIFDVCNWISEVNIQRQKSAYFCI